MVIIFIFIFNELEFFLKINYPKPLAPSKLYKSKLAPKKRLNLMNQKSTNLNIGAFIYPSERVNGKVNRVNHPSKGI